ncbi:IS701 family transposase [Nocardia seriolae]|uniref:IS701 family transposase n=1 Tax=Nocardia seriolae TaxID=37332 RepID=UPI002952ED59|nr:IS701 family transposase [Nocardia seriolae]BEK87843.1 hypothetical protein NSERKGN1266_37940 [Nocardia seriolae]
MVLDRVVAELDSLMSRIGGRFARSEPRERVREYVSGLLAGLERKNGWTLAERAGETGPQGMQRLLRAADWDVEAVRDDVRDYVVERLGDPEAVLAGDETGFLKKGVKSAGVQRQYSGTAGRTENCQIGVFLAYASTHGHALLDRELYVPQSWTSDRERCREAGIPDEVAFATKPRQMIAMLERAVAAKVPFRWFTADEACGQAGYLREWCEDHDVFYVLATRCDQQVATRADRIARADELVGEFTASTWQRFSVGAERARTPRIRLGATPDRGQVGERAWALAAGTAQHRQTHRDRLLPLLRPGHRPPGRSGLDSRVALARGGSVPAGQRRSRARPLPGPQLARLVRAHHVVDARPGLAGRFQSRCRKGGLADPSEGMIALTLPEIRRLLIAFVLTRHHRPDHVWAWSRFRRRRQHQARLSHYRRRGHPLT